MAYGTSRYTDDGEHVRGEERGSYRAPAVAQQPTPCPNCEGLGQRSVVSKGHSLSITCGRCFGAGVIEP